ncbi:hypothetical protein D3C78_536460 [compost metagenome]
MTFRLANIIGFQRGITLLNQQPVAVDLQQTVPFPTVIALRIERDRLFKLRDRSRTIAALGICLPQRAHGFAVGMIGAHRLL